MQGGKRQGITPFASLNTAFATRTEPFSHSASGRLLLPRPSAIRPPEAGAVHRSIREPLTLEPYFHGPAGKPRPRNEISAHSDRRKVNECLPSMVD